MKFKESIVLILIAGFIAFAPDAFAAPPGTYLGAPVIPYAKNIEEGRYETKMDFYSARRWFQKQFRGMHLIKRTKLVNQPGVKAIHFKNGYKKGKWAGINLYKLNQVVRFYIIPRDSAKAEIEAKKKKAAEKKEAKKKEKKKKK